PDAIHHDPGGERVFRAGDPAGQRESSVGRRAGDGRRPERGITQNTGSDLLTRRLQISTRQDKGLRRGVLAVAHCKYERLITRDGAVVDFEALAVSRVAGQLFGTKLLLLSQRVGERSFRKFGGGLDAVLLEDGLTDFFVLGFDLFLGAADHLLDPARTFI